jgi:hypothetical protein
LENVSLQSIKRSSNHSTIMIKRKVAFWVDRIFLKIWSLESSMKIGASHSRKNTSISSHHQKN